ncbi:MAG: RNA polymerase sigma factor [Acidobacteria bacterium]|nr:RNA polymerase sigma factor [Acidobacteriota bacterium]
MRLQSDEKLVAMTRGGDQGAYEALMGRYHSRILGFTRHMLGSREDAEDVTQESFAAAYSAMMADERPINVKPWLYRIARNRSLNHMRRQKAVGVDDFDLHVADHGRTTADEAGQREELRQLMGDVQALPESQRTALLLREIDALSYDQIAEAMETTVPSVKSLLVRARVGLAEAAEARRLSCDEVRLELGEVAEGLTRLSPPARRHVKDCDRCKAFKAHLKENNKALALMLPIGPLLLAKKFLFAQLGTAASASGGVGIATSGGLLSGAASSVATKAVATAAAAALVTAGAVEVRHATTTEPSRQAAPVVAQVPDPPVPAVTVVPVPDVREAASDAKAPATAEAPVAAPVEAPSTATEPAPATDAPPAPAPVEEHHDVVTIPPEPGPAPAPAPEPQPSAPEAVPVPNAGPAPAPAPEPAP